MDFLGQMNINFFGQMNVVNQVFFSIMLSAVSGRLLLFFWHKGKEKLEQIHPDLVYLLLRCVCVCHVLPIAYFVLQTTNRYNPLMAYFGLSQSYTDGFWKGKFYFNRIEGTVIFIVGTGYFFTVLRRMLQGCRERKKARRKWKAQNELERDAQTNAILAQVRKELKIRMPMKIYRNPYANAPMIAGMLRPRIILPVKQYTAGQLRIVFCHECMHYKSQDIFYKFLGVYIDALFPPKNEEHSVQVLLNEWSEYYCDRRVLLSLDGEVDARNYFGMIIRSMHKTPIVYNGDALISALGENAMRLERRMQYLKTYSAASFVGKGAAAVVAALVLVCTFVSYVIGAGVSDTVEVIRERGAVHIEEKPTRKVLEEYKIAGEEDRTYAAIISEQGETVSLFESGLQLLEYTVEPGIRQTTASFFASKGNVLQLSALESSGKEPYCLGIMDMESQDVRYVQGSGMLSNSFEVAEDGTYCVFVQNCGTKEIKITGNYTAY